MPTKSAATLPSWTRACARFLDWCEDRGLRLEQIEPVVVDAFRGLPYPYDGPDECP
ncbi:MAG: hypothetical protein WBE26_03770 [Phycisphaerae bacterium]